MYVVGSEEMRRLDNYTIESIGLPGAVLMENAGAQVADEVVRLYEAHHLEPQALTVVLAGHGNNGGDGFVAARHLVDRGFNVLLCLVGERQKLRGDALLHFNVYHKRRLPLWLLEEHSLTELYNLLSTAEVVVDALLGIGLRNEVRSPYRDVIQWLNKHGQAKAVLAVDLPSGLCADTGQILGTAVQATHTLTMACPKKGFFVQKGPVTIGRWKVADISIPTDVAPTLKLDLPRLITADEVVAAIPPRPAAGHKGTFGHVLVVGGSPNYIGAPLLTALAALACGAGLVTLAVPDTVYPLVAAQSPLPIYLALPTENNHLGSRALDILESRLSQYDILVAGPGLGRWPQGGEWLAALLKKWAGPAIIDADGLTLIQPYLSHIERKEPLVLTPHPGEMARLKETTVQQVEEDRLGIARQYARQHNLYLVLKGHRTILASPEELWINPIGHDALGKGGAGDVLSGMIAAFMAQGASPKQAGLAAVYLHALAGEQVAFKKSNYAVTATDLVNQLGEAILSLSSQAKA